ncbi:MAG: hypothetical protein AAB530_02800 [Patescibacteria group bacterium]
MYKNLPLYIERRLEKKELMHSGGRHSFEVFSKLNLNWQKLKEIYKKSQKPIGDLGASFSSLSVEGELQGINILPIDIMHESNKNRYEQSIKNLFYWDEVLNDVYYEECCRKEIKKDMKAEEPLEDYSEDISRATKKVLSKYILADLSKIPLKDRALCVSIVSHSIPKFSLNFETFLKEQLPEVLRITDQVAYFYPMSIYKSIQYEKVFDYEKGKYILKKNSNTDPKECKKKDEIETVLEEIHPLYKDTESIEQITELAKKLGFEFKLEKGHRLEIIRDVSTFSKNKLILHEQEESMLGVFTRKNKVEVEPPINS